MSGQVEGNKNASAFLEDKGAFVVALLALILSVASLGGNNAAKEAVMENIQVSDYYNFYQAKNQRQTMYKLASDELEMRLAANELPEPIKTAYVKKLKEYQSLVARYETDPDTKEGKKELLKKAKEHERLRDIAVLRDPWFDYAEALIQIAIVVISSAIIAKKRQVFYFAIILGGVGAICTVQGYMLF